MRFVALFIALIVPLKLFAAPYSGDEYEFSQPDGSTVTVLLFGDELHIDAESPDGYTLIRDEDGWICYAKLSEDGNEYVSTGIHYTGKSIAPTTVNKKARISGKSLREKRERNRKALGREESYDSQPAEKAKVSSGIQPAPGDTTYMKGVAIVIRFPDTTVANPTAANPNGTRVIAGGTAIPPAQVDSFFNFKGYTPNNGSVYDYYNDVSNGKMQYTNIVLPYVTLSKSKVYYDDGCSEGYKKVQEVLQEALALLKVEVESGRATLGEPSTTTSGNRNNIRALNVFLGGASNCDWAKGLWPHQGTFTSTNANYSITENGKTYYFRTYQMTNLGASQTATRVNALGTVVHENGHMIMGWPDLYPYDESIKAYVGAYCIMASSNNNPQQPNPYLRDLAGWIEVEDITNTNDVLLHVANSHTAYKYTRNANESYYIEARRRTGRSAAIPGDGLIVWHVHKSGDNTTLKAANPFPRIAVVPANGSGFVTPADGAAPTLNANSVFVAPSRVKFDQTTTPKAKYHDGTLSPILLSEVSAAPSNSNCNSMIFRIGEADSPSSGTVLPSCTGSSSSSRVVSSSSRVASSSSRAVSSSSRTPSSSSEAIISSSSSEVTPIITLPQIARSNSVIALKNTINLQAQSSAALEIYNLNGKLNKTLQFKSGVYSISLNDLPKGLYVVKVSFGGATPKTLRVIVQ